MLRFGSTCNAEGDNGETGDDATGNANADIAQSGEGYCRQAFVAEQSPWFSQSAPGSKLSDAQAWAHMLSKLQICA